VGSSDKEPTEIEEAKAPEAPKSVTGETKAELRIDESTVYTGEFLRRYRESRGVALKEIAERTRIGARSLQAIEEERFDDLPDARVYVRGFVRCLAEEIGLDPDLAAKSYLVRWMSWHEGHEGHEEMQRAMAMRLR
jgi:cytoskeletal protein RodZ